MSDTFSVALQSFLPASGSLLGHNQPIKPSDLDFIFHEEYPAKVGDFEPSDLAVGLPHLGSPTSVVKRSRKEDYHQGLLNCCKDSTKLHSLNYQLSSIQMKKLPQGA